MLCKVTHCAGCVSANTRPHQLRWGDWEMGDCYLMTTIYPAPQDISLHIQHMVCSILLGHAEVLVAKTHVCLNSDLTTLTENLPNLACPSYFMETHVFDTVVFHRKH